MEKEQFTYLLKIKVVLFLSLWAFADLNAQIDTLEVTDPEVHLRRTSILVSDLEKSLQLYRDILGFEVAIIAKSDQDSYAYTVFRIPKEAQIRIATLNAKDQSRIINLKEVTGVDLPKPVSRPLMSAMLLKVKDLREVMKKIRGLGLESTEEHLVKGTRISYREQSFIDPDGHLIALYQLL